MSNLNSQTIDILARGSHSKPEDGMCLLEAASFIAGEPFSDHPACVDPVLGAFGRAVNDFMTGDERKLLIPIVPKLVGTACDHTISLRRAMLLCDGSIRQILPMAFDAIDPAIAKTLRELQPITNQETAESARSAAAWSAAWSAESAARSAESAAWSAESAESAARMQVCTALVAMFNAATEIK